MDNERLYTVSQIAIMIKVHPLSVRRYIKEGKLKAIKIGGNVRIPESSLNTFTLDVSPNSNTRKSVKITRQKVFTLEDPFFRLRSAGMHLRQFE